MDALTAGSILSVDGSTVALRGWREDPLETTARVIRPTGMRHMMLEQSRAMEADRFNAVNRGVYISDNLPFLESLNSDSVDLVIIDPPFGKNQTFSGRIRPPLTKQERDVEINLLASWGITDIDGAYDRGIEYPDQEGKTAKFSDIWSFERVLDEDWWDAEQQSDTAVYWLIQSTRRTHGNSTAAYIAFMARRMSEIRRVLKSTGSVYLHCDHAANAYLRQMMDAVFGQRNFRNEIVWRRHNANNGVKTRYGNVTDTILFYTKTDKWVWNEPLAPRSETELARYKQDADGRWFKAQGLDGRGTNMFEWRGTTPRGGWRYSYEELERLWAEGRILTTKDGRPRTDGHIRYLDELPDGVKMQNLWLDLPRVANTSPERTGYPTQKPQALARRMIEASSNRDDLILDCFAGCAYVPVAAEELGRRWIACDMSPRAWTIVRRQFAKKPELAMTVEGEEAQYDAASPTFEGKGALRVFGPTQLPERNPIDLGLSAARQGRHLAPIGFRHNAIETSDEIWDAFVGTWDAFCWYCGTEKPKDRRELHLDHIEPNARDGSNDDCWNRALACAPCNSDKGNRLTPIETINKAFEAGRIRTPERRDEMIDLFDKRQQWAKERYDGLTK